MADISIVVPVYCSENCIPALETAVDNAMRAAGFTYELLLVDDASTDQSCSVVRNLAQRKQAGKGFCHRRNFGQDNAIMTGIRRATGAAVVVMDDDLQHAPADIPKLHAEMVRTGADVVYAHLRNPRAPTWKK